MSEIFTSCLAKLIKLVKIIKTTYIPDRSADTPRPCRVRADLRDPKLNWLAVNTEKHLQLMRESVQVDIVSLPRMVLILAHYRN